MEILVVDDNEEYRSLLKEALYSSGYTVYTAKDGIAACEILTSSEIDLIISDVQMPKMDGVKFHQFTREIERYKNAKFILLSGSESGRPASLELNPKIDIFLPKTTPLWEIMKLVDESVFGDYANTWLFTDRRP
jgi:CheY-like chemotaxis protein